MECSPDSSMCAFSNDRVSLHSDASRQRLLCGDAPDAGANMSLPPGCNSTTNVGSNNSTHQPFPQNGGEALLAADNELYQKIVELFSDPSSNFRGINVSNGVTPDICSTAVDPTICTPATSPPSADLTQPLLQLHNLLSLQTGSPIPPSSYIGSVLPELCPESMSVGDGRTTPAISGIVDRAEEFTPTPNSMTREHEGTKFSANNSFDDCFEALVIDFLRGGHISRGPSTAATPLNVAGGLSTSPSSSNTSPLSSGNVCFDESPRPADPPHFSGLTLSPISQDRMPVDNTVNVNRGNISPCAGLDILIQDAYRTQEEAARLAMINKAMTKGHYQGNSLLASCTFSSPTSSVDSFSSADTLTAAAGPLGIPCALPQERRFSVKFLVSEYFADFLVTRHAHSILTLRNKYDLAISLTAEGHYFPGSQERMLAVSGVSESAVIPFVDFFVERSHEKLKGTEEVPMKVKVRIAAPRAVIGSLIGKKGSYIQSVRVMTGAFVYVSPLFVGADEACSERLVTVSSLESARLRSATLTIVNKINESVTHGSSAAYLPGGVRKSPLQNSSVKGEDMKALIGGLAEFQPNNPLNVFK